MKKIFFLLLSALLLSACSSDDPKFDDPNAGGGGNGGTGTEGGTGGTGTDTNGANLAKTPSKRKTIPAEKVNGKWIFDPKAVHYTIECGDNETYEKIKKDLLEGQSDDAYPRRGYFEIISGKPTYDEGVVLKPEGQLGYNYRENSTNVFRLGDYYTHNDSIHYYHWTLRRMQSMRIQGNRLYYHFDDTKYFQNRHPNVKKVIYYAEYVKE